ncbi:hypothetical protein CFIO01_10875 [Colletotrichum fioriniae PJ7]|uniref:Uncharacterized protein n=1 Tax=Colletotrichum fioriniae PJ7 TaxID=1445577 RepID=A0A010RYS9_9PEZI|nr:hypothetical protein CFIO01_10875 [Colletotrichum fioriniae PJ7]
MRASAVLMALFATLVVAVPSNLDSVNLPSLLETRQCAKAGTCSKGGDKGESCSALKCCSNSKSGRGGQARLGARKPGELDPPLLKWRR